MLKKSFFILIYFYIFLSYPQTFIEAPFVSNLTFEVSNQKVLLSWKNPLNFNEYLSIYRSNEVINTTEKIVKAKKIAILKNREENYIDIPDQEGEYYYAVIITDKNSMKEILIFIPYRNYTMKPAVIRLKAMFKLNSFNATAKDNYALLSWDYEGPNDEEKKISIYRSTQPINKEESLKIATKISSTDISSKSYVDLPLPDIPYYYGIFIEDEQVKSFIPRVNITDTPIIIQGKTSTLTEFSFETFKPLPLLTIQEDPITGKPINPPQASFFPRKIECNDKVKKIIEEDKNENKELFINFQKELQKKKEILQVKILSNEQIFEPIEYKTEYKSAIELIKNQKYDEAFNILKDLINLILNEELLVRVSYYLGIMYYIKAEDYHSFIYLNYSYNNFKKEVEPYLESIYTLLFDKIER